MMLLFTIHQMNGFLCGTHDAAEFSHSDFENHVFIVVKNYNFGWIYEAREMITTITNLFKCFSLDDDWYFLLNFINTRTRKKKHCNKIQCLEAVCECLFLTNHFFLIRLHPWYLFSVFFLLLLFSHIHIIQKNVHFPKHCYSIVIYYSHLQWTLIDYHYC